MQFDLLEPQLIQIWTFNQLCNPLVYDTVKKHISEDDNIKIFGICCAVVIEIIKYFCTYIIFILTKYHNDAVSIKCW